MVILNWVEMEENENIELKNPFIYKRNVYILIIHINNYHYPGTTCVITIFCQFFFGNGQKKIIHQIAGVRLRLEFWSKLEKPLKQFPNHILARKTKLRPFIVVKMWKFHGFFQ